MKKTAQTALMFVAALFLSLSIQAQEGNLLAMKDKSDKDILNAKKNIKAATWKRRGDIHRDIANDQTGIFFNEVPDAVFIAYEAYKKSNELGSKSATADLAGLYYPALRAGAISYQEDEFEPAYQAFRLASEVAPDSLTPVVYAADVAYRLDKTAEYEQLMRKSLGYAPADFQALGTEKANYYINLAMFYFQDKEDNESAGKTLEEGLAEFPSNKDIRNLTVEYYIRTNKLEQAISDLEKSVADSPNDADLVYNLGIIYEKSGNTDKAKECYRKAISIDSKHVNARYNLAALPYNQAAAILKEVRNMDDKEYAKNGKAKEKEVEDKFRESLTLFEALRAENVQDANVRQGVLIALQGIYSRLKMNDKFEEVTAELDAMN
ncbi:tetratricopeptide repeat protein [Eisenibacter elegans]|uniref:tetratricopeptide repeat protein n=1 Tax=Eisenibacter elegans TaxID=997 RepID=UPI0004798BD8|nr:tetratricopeptide repeat protein [Eisenibacter elegans]